MSTKETARRCRAEIWNPTLMDREPWINWEAAGAPTMYDRIRARLQEILATHKPPPLPDGAVGKIKAVLQAAEAREEKKRR